MWSVASEQIPQCLPVPLSQFVSCLFYLSQCHWVVLIINQHLLILHTYLNYIRTPSSQGVSHNSLSPFPTYPATVQECAVVSRALSLCPMGCTAHSNIIQRTRSLDEFQSEPQTDHFLSPDEKTLQTINIHKWERLSWANQHFTHCSKQCHVLPQQCQGSSIKDSKL